MSRKYKGLPPPPYCGNCSAASDFAKMLNRDYSSLSSNFSFNSPVYVSEPELERTYNCYECGREITYDGICSLCQDSSYGSQKGDAPQLFDL